MCIRDRLTPPLRDYAQIGKKGVLLGQGAKLELWDEEHWFSRRDAWLSEPTGSEITDELRSISL